ncbi:LysR substrate-binding domain-containing protein [Gluconacetobacter sacchari]|uniref:LysR family transcriptional regulator n=2 Tax=Gluconacetobacter sacchari TaxID=92759 RepID=A0A7W4NQE5_9PROT|nr:LysR substrate-binding domain-containing protein [Gluconacetobacter sacchari]MBB2162327.1 LysR family transcriptional regulator [Gluconacetobacter sacchari]GBQ20460.1 LysR family transcriptional regulator [Gluconacetobacter sacchari DSM 12717]
MRQRLPLTAMEAFCAVARHLSFRGAAEAIGVSQSALSRHVQNLERDLGVPLFARRGNTIALTEKGRLLFAKAEQAFQWLHEGLSQVAERAAAPLRVSVLPSLAASWLAPRLPGFMTAHRDIAVELVPDYHLADLDAGSTDLALRYGTGPWRGTWSRMFMREELAPVAAPAAWQDSAEGEWIFAGRTVFGAARPFEWDRLLDALGVSSRPAVMSLNDYNVVISATLAGQGIMVGRRSLLQSHFDDGRLVRVRTPWMDCGTAYHVVTRPGRQHERAIGAFIAWLASEGAATNALWHTDRLSQVMT